MPHRDILALGEGEPEQAAGAIERRLDHVVEREIGLDGGVIEISAALTQPLGVIAPVPGRELEIAALLGHQRLQIIAVGKCAGASRLPDPFQQAAHGFRRLGHGILEPVGGVGRIAENPGALLAQLQNLDDGRVVVVAIAVVAARDEGLVHFFAQIAPRRTLEERLDGGARRGHDRLAGKPPLFGGGLRGGDEAVGEAGPIVITEFHDPVLLVGKQMVAEAGAEIGEPFVDLGHPLLRGLVKAGAGTVEAGIGALQKSHLLGGQTQARALLVQQGDAAEQHRIHHDRVPVPGHPRRHLLVDLEDGRVRMRRDKIVEHGGHAVQQFAGTLQCRDGVGEVGRCRILRNRSDLGSMIREGPLEGREKMLRLDGIEGRRLKWSLPGRKQRICVGLRYPSHQR